MVGRPGTADCKLNIGNHNWFTTYKSDYLSRLSMPLPQALSMHNFRHLVPFVKEPQQSCVNLTLLLQKRFSLASQLISCSSQIASARERGRTKEWLRDGERVCGWRGFFAYCSCALQEASLTPPTRIPTRRSCTSLSWRRSAGNTTHRERCQRWKWRWSKSTVVPMCYLTTHSASTKTWLGIRRYICITHTINNTHDFACCV